MAVWYRRLINTCVVYYEYTCGFHKANYFYTNVWKERNASGIQSY